MRDEKIDLLGRNFIFRQNLHNVVTKRRHRYFKDLAPRHLHEAQLFVDDFLAEWIDATRSCGDEKIALTAVASCMNVDDFVIVACRDNRSACAVAEKYARSAVAPIDYRA